MTATFFQLLPEMIFEAVETLGGRATGRFLQLNAMENRVYDVEREEDGNVVIKFYRPGRWSRDTILAEHAFLKATAESEIPVVCPLENAAGETLQEKDGIMFAVFPKRPGRLEAEPTEEQLKRLGRFLGRIHNVGARMKGVARGRLDVEHFGRTAFAELERLDVIPQSNRRAFTDYANRLFDIAEPMLSGVEFVLLHGDCHVGNVLWKQDDPYFIDFDDMIHAPPVQDVWMLAGGHDDYQVERRRILLAAYETMRKFDYQTLRLMEPLRGLRMVHFSAWIARRWEDPSFKRMFPLFPTERYWQEQIEGLSAVVEKLSGETQF